MSAQQDFGVVRYEDGLVTVGLAPPVAIGGWTIRWTLQRRFGHTDAPVAMRWLASGYNGVSGITVVDSGQGVFSVQLNAGDCSGLNFGNYAAESKRIDSGFNTVLSQGFLQLGAGVG